MEIGAAIFFTDYSMAPTDLAVALEQRGFDSLWVAEHSHMPVTRRFTHPLGEAAHAALSDFDQSAQQNEFLIKGDPVTARATRAPFAMAS
jgi:alkanesulfonate monooxygenase SsuD/methylene tetrahydromethanopterin reductase-like flavin-dependent oxidoreductase (luciferase family)